jgi:hypothetical protein
MWVVVFFVLGDVGAFWKNGETKKCVCLVDYLCHVGLLFRKKLSGLLLDLGLRWL